MEQFIISIACVLGGCLIGWEARSCLQKFKQDREGIKLREARELLEGTEKLSDGRTALVSVYKGADRSIIVEAEKIIEEHLKRKKLFDSIKDNNRKEDKA